MVLQLDARVPRVWRSPSSLQFGVDPARVILETVSYADEHMISALVEGISRSGLSMVASSTGGSEPDVERLLDALSPVLASGGSGGSGRSGASGRSATIAIVGSGITVERIALLLRGAGDRVAVTSEPSGAGCSLAIAVGHYVLDPKLYGFWLRRDIPHLAVVFGDTGATVGRSSSRAPARACIAWTATAATPIRPGPRSPPSCGVGEARWSRRWWPEKWPPVSRGWRSRGWPPGWPEPRHPSVSMRRTGG